MLIKARIFKNKPFTRFAQKAGITDEALCKAIHDAENGLITADLGGGVIKQRIARTGKGKSGGFRSIILFKTGSKAFFVHGFAKNDRENLEADELAMFKQLAAKMLHYNETELNTAISKGLVIEVACPGA